MLPCGTRSATFSPGETPSRRARSRPSITPNSPGLSALRPSPPSHNVAAGKEALPLHVRRNGLHIAARFDFLGNRRPVVDRPKGRRHLNMRNDGEHSVANFLLKAVHHGEHDDERSDAERNRSNRHARNKGHEAVSAPASAARSRIGESDQEFKGRLHCISSGPLGPLGIPWSSHSSGAAAVKRSGIRLAFAARRHASALPEGQQRGQCRP